MAGGSKLLTIAFIFILSEGCIPVKKGEIPAVKTIEAGKEVIPSDTLLTQLLKRHPQYFDTLLKNDSTWKIQIIYTQIDRDEKNFPHFTHHYYRLNQGQYFYPASTVKLPVAILALQKINELNIKELDKNSTMITEAAYSGQSRVFNDPSAPDGRPTIAHYIKKILLVSDNDAFNRLYEFLGQEYLNRTLHKMGYDSTQIIHRLSIALSEEQNRRTNPVYFFDTLSRLLYRQPLVQSTMQYAKRNTFVGKGYYRGGKLVMEPFDFSSKNRLSLSDLHSMVQSIIFPQAVPVSKRFQLKPEDYLFLQKYMSMWPYESAYPSYDSSYSDAYVKFLMYGGSGNVKSPSIRIFNKVGDAYGFLTDAAYVADFENGIEFMLSATIHCNPDGIYNDDQYAYEEAGFPFLKNLGQVIYQYEKDRKRKQVPDLSSFKINYSN